MDITKIRDIVLRSCGWFLMRFFAFLAIGLLAIGLITLTGYGPTTETGEQDIPTTAAWLFIVFGAGFLIADYFVSGIIKEKVGESMTPAE